MADRSTSDAPVGPGAATASLRLDLVTPCFWPEVRRGTERFVRDLGDGMETRKADLAASYQRAIVRALVERAQAAAEREQLGTIAVVGGVAANSELRAALPDARFAPLPLCTDNAAMIASAGRYGRRLPYPRYLDLDAYASRA